MPSPSQQSLESILSAKSDSRLAKQLVAFLPELDPTGWIYDGGGTLGFSYQTQNKTSSLSCAYRIESGGKRIIPFDRIDITVGGVSRSLFAHAANAKERDALGKKLMQACFGSAGDIEDHLRQQLHAGGITKSVTWSDIEITTEKNSSTVSGRAYLIFPYGSRKSVQVPLEIELTENRSGASALGHSYSLIVKQKYSPSTLLESKVYGNWGRAFSTLAQLSRNKVSLSKESLGSISAQALKLKHLAEEVKERIIATLGSKTISVNNVKAGSTILYLSASSTPSVVASICKVKKVQALDAAIFKNVAAPLHLFKKGKQVDCASPSLPRNGKVTVIREYHSPGVDTPGELRINLNAALSNPIPNIVRSAEESISVHRASLEMLVPSTDLSTTFGDGLVCFRFLGKDRSDYLLLPHAEDVALKGGTVSFTEASTTAGLGYILVKEVGAKLKGSGVLPALYEVNATDQALYARLALALQKAPPEVAHLLIREHGWG